MDVEVGGAGAFCGVGWAVGLIEKVKRVGLGVGGGVVDGGE